jgi:hypothetical protein
VPALVWHQTESGPQSEVETDWPTFVTVEEWRVEAEELDQMLDDLLDGAVRRVADISTSGTPIEFTRAWSIGSSILDSGVLLAPAMKNEQRSTLWRALSQKCRTGVRSDRQLETSWAELRPSTAREPRREGRRLDYFELCLWVAEQSFEDAAETFGGSVRNGWQMLERPTLRPVRVRRAFLAWLRGLDPVRSSQLVEPRRFAEMMKKLRAHWPDRGPGSARRPIHLNDDQLLHEISNTLESFERSDGD